MSDNQVQHSPNLSQLITSPEEKDAIHIAIAPVKALEKLKPGQHIGITRENLATSNAKHIGIVSPFLTSDVHPQEEFWMLLYPNTITSLRHMWTHPDFIEKPPLEKETSRQWLQNYADKVDLEYDDLIAAAISYYKFGHYIIDGGKWEGEYVPDEFWDHFQTVTERRVNRGDRGSFFSCSC